MAITSTTTLPKFRALCRSLGMPQAWVLGHLEMFWQTCHTHGHVMRSEDFEEAAGWTEACPDRAGDFIHACLKHRWLDVDGDTVAAHDYLANAPRFVKDRERNRERIKAWRDRKKDEKCNASVTDCNVTVTQCNADVTHVTKCNELEIEGEGEGDVEEDILNTHVVKQPAKPRRTAAKAATTHKYSDAFEAAWKAYPHHGCRSSKSASWEKWRNMRLESNPEIVERVMRWLKWCASQHDWTKNGGQFVPGMQVWLSKHQWGSDEPPEEKVNQDAIPEEF